MTIVKAEESSLNQKIESKQLWDAEDVAHYLKISIKSVYRWAELGKIPHIKVGEKLVRFDPQVICQWVKLKDQVGCRNQD